MHRIYFDELDKRKDWLLLMVFALILILIGLVTLIIDLPDGHFLGLAMPAGGLLQALFFSRPYWYKHYVQWNKLGITIRVNSWWAKSLHFRQIKVLEVREQELVIHQYYGKPAVIDLNGVRQDDRERLAGLISQFIPANRLG